MTANGYAAQPLPAEPAWPDGGGKPLLFLLDASSPLERKLLTGWIERHTPAGTPAGAVQSAAIPASRRRRRRRDVDPRLEAFLRTDDDPLLVPLRVVWLVPERRGDRAVGWRDLLSFGDPRDPDPVRQHFILRTRPERCRIIMGAPGFASRLRADWASPEGRGRSDGTSLGDFVALRGWLALERAERQLRGNRYKVPKFLKEDLFESRSFSQGIARLARDSGESFDKVANRTYRYLKEIAATHSPYVIDLMAGAIRWLIDQAYAGLHYDKADLSRIYALGQEHPLVFLPSHKSNFDHLVLQYALYLNELPPNHTAGGINLNFFPVGPLVRRSGVFFIRRSFKDNEAYKMVLGQYLDYLLEKRFPLEWYIEGGRSRSGKLRAPRFGMLAYVADSYTRGSADDVILVPVAIAYDQISDVGSYAAEQRGAKKEREGFGWLVRTIRNVRRRYGSIHLRFGTPISMADRLGTGGSYDTEDHGLAIRKLAFEISSGINRATPITPISLVTLALLSKDRALTVEETLAALEPFLEYVKRRDLPHTESIALDTPERVRVALDDLAENGVVTRFVGATDTVYAIGEDQHLAAAYYRNTIIHFFVNGAIAELALVRAGEPDVADPAAEFWTEALALRDQLKFEFFFSDRAVFLDELRDELAVQCAEWEELLAAGDVRALLLNFRPPRSQAVLRPFVEAYRVVGDVLETSPTTVPLEHKELLKASLALGKQYHLQRRIRSAESVSSVLFESAIKLADNRGLLEPSPTIEADRQEFAENLRRTVARIDTIAAIVAGRQAGLLD
jgi:glycerol-3-phosphate O-acyltransferase